MSKRDHAGEVSAGSSSTTTMQPSKKSRSRLSSPDVLLQASDGRSVGRSARVGDVPGVSTPGTNKLTAALLSQQQQQQPS